MATLQIRDLPDPLSQQALSDLQQACGGDPRERRRQALADLQALARREAAVLLTADQRLEQLAARVLP